MLEKLGIRSNHASSDVTTHKTDPGAKPQGKQKGAATSMPSSGLQIGSFAQKARHKLTHHSAQQTPASHAFGKLGFGDDAAAKTGTHDGAAPSVKSDAPPPKPKDSVVADVPADQRDAQYQAVAKHNQAFESHLHGMGLEVVHNSGSNNNCAIYSLLDIAAPKLDQAQRHQAAREVRASFDKTHPGEQGRMLLLDMQQGGHGQALVSLVNKKFGVNMEVGVVQAGYEAEHPVTQIGTLRGEGANAKPPTHHGVVWDKHGHYEAIRESAPKVAQTKVAQTKTADIKAAETKPQTTTPAPVKTEAGKSKPFAKLASIGKWRGGASGAKSADKKTESYQLAELNFKSDTADWSKDTQKAVGEASKLKDNPDPKFTLPPRKRDIGQAYDRSKPGFTAIETAGIRPFGNLLNAAAAGLHGEQAYSALLGAGGGVAGLHDAALGAMNGHALVASRQKAKRYGQQLDAMLAKDVEKFKKDPKLETLMLTKDAKGNWAYDMEKVAKLATSDKPEHKEASEHAKNVFLTAYIKDEVAGKRQNRATYELTRNTIGIASAGAILGGTLGMGAVPASAAAVGAKSAGLGLGFMNALDGAKGVRGLKQRMRDDKESEIDSRFLNKRMDMKHVAYPPATPQEAINGTHAKLKDDAKVEANDVLFRRLLTGQHIDETKSTDAKKGRAEIAAKHAYAVVDYHVNEYAAEKEGNLEAFHRNLNEPGMTQKDKTKRLTESIKGNDSLRSAYDLMRDVGMRRGEARAATHKLIMRKIETEIAKDPDRRGAATEAAQKYDGKPEAGDIRDMRAVLRRH
jgi:hypothetical protein